MKRRMSQMARDARVATLALRGAERYSSAFYWDIIEALHDFPKLVYLEVEDALNFIHAYTELKRTYLSLTADVDAE